MVFGHVWFLVCSARPIGLRVVFVVFVVLPSMPMPTVARSIVLMWFLWVGGLVVLPSMLDADGCAFARAHVVFCHV